MPEHDAFWADRFDVDLLKVVPGIDLVVDDLADVRLQTRSGVTNGRINCPAAWHTDLGLTSFFSTDGSFPSPPGYYTGHPLVECTWMEVLRDEWVHSAVVVVNGRPVWSPPTVLMERLMSHVRGWNVLETAELEAVHERVSQSVHGACEGLLIATEDRVR